VNWGLQFKRGQEQAVLIGFNDINFVGDVDSRTSTSGVIFFLNQSSVTWQSTKQNVVAHSSCEAEYVVAANGTFQAFWLNRVLGEIEGTEPVHYIRNLNRRHRSEMHTKAIISDLEK
jgi:hypothetical protein